MEIAPAAASAAGAEEAASRKEAKPERSGGRFSICEATEGADD